MAICANNSSAFGIEQFTSDQIACVGAGASLNAEKTDLYNAIAAYMTAVGA
jgi:hypothetical protein